MTHLTKDQLIEQLYGAGGAEAHLRECGECSEKFEALKRTKARLQDEAGTRLQVPAAFLAEQRRAIYARLDQAAASHVRWAPALAGAGLLAMGLLWLPHAQLRTPPVRDRVAAQTESSSDKLISDLYSMEQSVEPQATAPIHELFEDAAGAGEQ